MPTSPLKYLSEKKLLDLGKDIAINRERYQSGDFRDLEIENGWAIEAKAVSVDYDLLSTLDGNCSTAAADIENSLVLHKALTNMTPALAREERIWVRLAHVECLEYSRKRWLSNVAGEQLDSQVKLHMFAPTRNSIRDDNALSRLWWNFHIATIADPNEPEEALRLILKTSDIRSNLVERPWTAARVPLVRAIIRAMRRNDWIASNQPAFRHFMKILNRDGGGILFEVLSELEADRFMDSCATRAQAQLDIS